MSAGSTCYKHEANLEDHAMLGDARTPVFRGAGQYQVLGMAIFAYAYVTTIPSWANEKRPQVRATLIPEA
jgi:hypothetical protein